jgi:RHS repeat-associated protein
VLSDPQLPAGVADSIDEAPSARGLWFRNSTPTQLLPASSSSDDVLIYHSDHLGSVSLVTNAVGGLSNETAYYPFGHTRVVIQPGGSATNSPYGFGGKERESETGLQNFGTRYYAPHLGVFTQPDPQFIEFTDLAKGDQSEQESFRRFLTQPQMGNVYGYANGNPVKYIDLDGREIEVSDVLRKDVPLFKEALKLVGATDEGKRLLKSLSGKDFKIYMRASLPNVKDAKVGEGTSALGQQYSGWRGEGKNLKANEYATLLNIKAHWKISHVRTREDFVYELADTIFHELRHAEGDVFAQSPLVKTLESAFGIKYDAYKHVHDALDRPGTTGRTDPSLDQFQSELRALRERAEIEKNIDMNP